jgi:acetate kinase
MTYHNKVIRDEALTLPTHEQAFQATLSTFHQISLPTPTTCVHRVVHGGPRLIEPVLVNDSVIQELKNIIVFAPLHLPNEIATIEAAIKAFPDISQIACFDTAFHNHMPEGAKRLPLPRPLWVKGIHRYGFHGLSYEYVVNHLKGQLNGRTIIAHLGNGCSMVALKDGHPQDTTMGLTPTGGLMMGTRSGDLDPGVLFYLLRNEVVHSTDPVARVERMLNDESGLLGVSELSRNMEDLLKAESESTAVREAIELFCYCAIKNIGALSAILGGLDKLVFTGGIGENSPFVQKRICEGLNFLKPYDVLTVHTDENLMMAKHASSLLSKGRT